MILGRVMFFATKKKEISRKNLLEVRRPYKWREMIVMIRIIMQVLSG